MIAGLLMILGVYGLCAVIIHAFYAYSRRTGESEEVYQLVVVTRNSAAKIEWYLYAYLFVSWLRGRQTVITVFDDSSEDETVSIVRKVAEEWPNVRLYESIEGLDLFLEEHESQPLLLLHLFRMDLSPKRPLHQW
ncbi:hypothetical protein [Gorillibacterium timonense]|uniref:hypothetical protein n=1 Tax=Gorillibacterium timonense TaxID=1689269 RepID=UPI00071CC0EF|nr:hypothetical protein [Gorillibacterium timonense]